MIGQVQLTSSSYDCLSYCLGKQKNAEILAINGLLGENAIELSKQFDAIQDEKRNISNAIWHASISFAYQDDSKINNDLMVKIGLDYLNLMKFNNQHQYIIIKHNDKKHKHFHVIANRIGFDNQIVSDFYCKNLTARACDKLELKYNLIIAREQPRKSNKFDNKKEQAKVDIRQVVNEALHNIKVKSINELEDYLKTKNIGMAIRLHSKTGEAYGISFSIKNKNNDKTYKFKGSLLGLKYSEINKVLYKNNKEINKNQNTYLNPTNQQNNFPNLNNLTIFNKGFTIHDRKENEDDYLKRKKRKLKEQKDRNKDMSL